MCAIPRYVIRLYDDELLECGLYRESGSTYHVSIIFSSFRAYLLKMFVYHLVIYVMKYVVLKVSNEQDLID